MNSTRRISRGGEKGFTLIELLVVIMIIAVLAAIALPAFLGQRAKAQDGSAKSDARTMVSAMESCFTEEDEYDPCPNETPGVTVGTGPGQVEVSSSGATYTVVSHSISGNTFTIARSGSSTVTRSCSSAGDPRGGCLGSAW